MPTLLNIRSLVVSCCQTNCYVVSDPATSDALVIDPGDNAEAICEIVESDRLIVRGIVNTHCHGDHIAANGPVKARYNCPIMIHELDAPGLVDRNINLAALMGYDGPVSPPADRLLKDGDTICMGNVTFRVLHTPGHTAGGICLYTDGILFAGDTLFSQSIGRTDFPGGSHSQIIESIRRQLLVLPNDTVVYPGHGPNTSIGQEQTINPYL